MFAVDEDPARAARADRRLRRGRGEPPTGRVRSACAPRPPLSQADGGLAAYAAALLNWHRRHRFCAACGAPTEVGEGGLVAPLPALRRRAPPAHRPGRDHARDRRATGVLLGRQASWPPGRYSALAGFVEPGESLEEAVAREVLEEAGVEVGPPRVRRLAAVAVPGLADARLHRALRARASRDRVDEELEDVRWFDRRESWSRATRAASDGAAAAPAAASRSPAG